MVVYDSVYGRVVVPRELEPLVLAPEVRRLSQVRLLNGLSPSVSSLTECRRYSHTLGVLHLTELLGYEGLDHTQRRALQAAALLHDVGTPPFGHLMEYHLKEQGGWNHEQVARAILWGKHAPENSAHQIFAGRTVQFRRQLLKSPVSFELVDAIVRRSHPLSKLLFGTLDLDNIDNVARMAHGLGEEGAKGVAEILARNIGLTEHGDLLLNQSLEPYAQRWLDMRRFVYQVLSFDGPTMASQAVLSKAIAEGLAIGLLSESDWDLSDEGLILRLLGNRTTKKSIAHEYLGVPPPLVMAVQAAVELDSLGVANRMDLIERIEEIAGRVMSHATALGHVIVDNGTFSRELRFLDPGGSRWGCGSTSRSLVLYVFARHRSSVNVRFAARVYEAVLCGLGLSKEQVLCAKLGSDDSTADQPEFGFKTA